MKNNFLKTAFLGGLFLISVLSTHAQVLFHAGKARVSSAEFLQAFEKLQSNKPRAEALKEYLPLYIDYQLKLQEARHLQLDSFARFKEEIAGFRRQMAEYYLQKRLNLDSLATQAVNRSLKDISFNYLALPYPPGNMAGRQEAAKLAQQIKREWQQGAALDDLLTKYSEAIGSGKSFGGNGGWINVFSLPYNYEVALYALSQNSITNPLTGNTEIYLFQKTGERPAMGKRRASQILLLNAANESPAITAQKSRLADSLYQALKRGSEFSQLAFTFSDDKSSYANGGRLQHPVSPGEYEEAFERSLFALKNPGDISAPFRSSYGTHILKLDEILPNFPANPDLARQEAKALLEKSEIMKMLDRQMMEQNLQLWNYRSSAIDHDALWQFADSAMHGAAFPAGYALNENSILFTIDNEAYTVSDWLDYAIPAHNHNISWSDQFWEYVRAVAVDYFTDHLEKYEPAFAAQLKDFEESNLVFELSNEHLWKPANDDLEAQKKYYAMHKDNYLWQSGVQALSVVSADSVQLTRFRRSLLQHPANWRQLLSTYSNVLYGDSSRYEWRQLNAGDFEGDTMVGAVSPIYGNPFDNSYNLVYIFSPVEGGDPRSFEESRGLVINDYQQQMEKEWLERLRAKYPVKLIEREWKRLLK